MTDARHPGRHRLLEAALRCYPRSWRHERQAETLWMVEQERVAGRPVSWAALLDLAAHGLEVRADVGLRFLTGPFRARAAVLATSATAVLSLLLLVMVERGGLTLGAYMFAGFLLAFGLTAAGQGGTARLVNVVTTATIAAVPVWSAVTGAARPPLFVLGPLFLLGLLSCLATSRLSRRHRKRLLATTATFAGIFVLQLVAWSAFAHRGPEVGVYRRPDDLSLLAIALQGTVLAALVATTVHRSWRRWLPAVSVTGTLLLLYCDPAEPAPALVVTTLCWMTTAASTARPTPVRDAPRILP